MSSISSKTTARHPFLPQVPDRESFQAEPWKFSWTKRLMQRFETNSAPPCASLMRWRVLGTVAR